MLFSSHCLNSVSTGADPYCPGIAVNLTAELKWLMTAHCTRKVRRYVDVGLGCLTGLMSTVKSYGRRFNLRDVRVAAELLRLKEGLGGRDITRLPQPLYFYVNSPFECKL